MRSHRSVAHVSTPLTHVLTQDECIDAHNCSTWEQSCWLQVSAAIQAVNLAAPYARLSSGSAPGDLAAALRAIGLTYSPQSLQVSTSAGTSVSHACREAPVRQQPRCATCRELFCMLRRGYLPEATFADSAVSTVAMWLQVSAPAWAAEAAQAARDPAHEGKLRFVMSGVSLPGLDATRLRWGPALEAHRNLCLPSAMPSFAGSLLSWRCLRRGSSHTPL